MEQINNNRCRNLCPRGLRLRSAAARFMGLRVRIPPGAWLSVSCECCVRCQVAVFSSGYHSFRVAVPNMACLSAILKSRQRGAPGLLGAVAAVFDHCQDSVWLHMGLWRHSVAYKE